MVNCGVLDHSTEKDQARYRNGEVILVDLEVVEMLPKRKKLTKICLKEYPPKYHQYAKVFGEEEFVINRGK